jgi:beta-ureidopropionase / N-carbamoyl-L-amino-acid hydrolase
MINAADLDRLLADLLPIGQDEIGATTRLAWTDEDEAAAAWFARRAKGLGREMVRDPAGNLWACPPEPGPWWAVGSHLDTVRSGGRFDGALGVAAAFAAASVASVPLAVISFADEEGARFNTPTFGSRALVGRLDCADAIDRTDEHGILLGDAMAEVGVDPERLGEAPTWLEKLRGFLELHIDQTRDLAAAGAPAGSVAGLAARLRLQAELVGRADHAGTTRKADRHDALAAAARLIVRGDELAGEDMVFTAARIEVEPNAPTTVPSRVRLWLDARAETPEELAEWRAAFEAAAPDGALRVAAENPGTAFPEDVVAAFGDLPRLVCFAGHDAGILADRIPAGMVFVRNPSGVSHAPEEDVDLGDAAVAANALVAAAERLAR